MAGLVHIQRVDMGALEWMICTYTGSIGRVNLLKFTINCYCHGASKYILLFLT